MAHQTPVLRVLSGDPPSMQLEGSCWRQGEHPLTDRCCGNEVLPLSVGDNVPPLHWWLDDKLRYKAVKSRQCQRAGERDHF